MYLVSIITVVKNAVSTIEKTMLSVLEQTYPNIEYIVIDGGSTDGTREKIESYRSRISVIIHESDSGISEAFNKGIKRAKGEFIGILNADDWYDKLCIERSVNSLESNQDAGFSFGDCLFFSDNEPSYIMKGDSEYWKNIAYFLPSINHPTVLVRKYVYEKVGLFSERWLLAMDYDFILRCELMGIRGTYIPQILSNASLGGASDKFPIRAIWESYKISLNHGGKRFQAIKTLLKRSFKRILRNALSNILPNFFQQALRKKANTNYSTVGKNSRTH